MYATRSTYSNNTQIFIVTCFAIVKFRDILSVKSKWPDIIRTYVLLSGNVPTNGVAIKLLIVIEYI